MQLLGDRGIAERTRLVEELLLDADLPLRDLGPRRILFHGHCHQKALAGTAATVALLKKLPEHRGRRARRRLLRHGRVLRFRVRALRAVHAHRRDAPVPGGAQRARGDADRRHRRLLPPADPRTAPGARRAIRCRSCETHSLGRARCQQNVISILVLVAIFVIGTLRPINMGLLGIIAAFIVGTAVGVDEDDDLRRLPRRPVHHPRRRHLPVRDRQQQRHRGLARARRGPGGRRPRGADPVGDVRRHRRADRGRLGRARGGRDHRADRARVRRQATGSTRC